MKGWLLRGACGGSEIDDIIEKIKNMSANANDVCVEIRENRIVGKRRVKVTTSKLNRLFDFQRFEGNTRLQKLIDEAHRRVDVRELTDDELDQVAAAGAPESSDKNGPKVKPQEHST